ncbi:hypothetical protein WME79_18100 [Sorangium sp. So ce726]|uniref:hypothetical protein n=1 Tax=Sorangium sp. So ce726 TaxID=3133319 RepID=UPI003F5DA095
MKGSGSGALNTSRLKEEHQQGRAAGTTVVPIFPRRCHEGPSSRRGWSGLFALALLVAGCSPAVVDESTAVVGEPPAVVDESPTHLPDGGGGAPTEPPPPAACGASAVDGVAVLALNVDMGAPEAPGAPPYAIDGCWLVYVAAREAGDVSGALKLRDLRTGEELLLAPAAEVPRRPALAGDVVVWEATDNGTRVVRARRGGQTETIRGPFDHAGEPRVNGDAVVLTGWLTADEKGDTDVFLYEIGQAEAVQIASGPGQQRFPDISATHVAFADFSEDPDGRFDEDARDLADIVVYDRRTRRATPRSREGKQSFPMLGAGERVVAYLEWAPLHPEPKFGQFDLRIGDIAAPADGDAMVVSIEQAGLPYVLPAVRGELVEWVQRPAEGDASLWRRPADLSAPAAEVPGLSAFELFGPSPSATITVLAARSPGGELALRGVAR